MGKKTNLKMVATSHIIAHDLQVRTKELDDSLFMDTFLSKNETEEVERMLGLEGEMSKNTGLDYGARHKGFITSTQMVRTGIRRASSLILSPIMDPNYVDPSCDMSKCGVWT